MSTQQGVLTLGTNPLTKLAGPVLVLLILAMMVLPLPTFMLKMPRSVWVSLVS